MVLVEVPKAAYIEESAPGAPVQEKMVEAPALMGVVGSNVSPCADDVTFVPGSFDIVDLGIGESGLSGYPRVLLLSARWGQVAGVQS
jgi:hypothetical protein